ncbi:hypothetical protein [Staphylococcus pseudintermedius]|uniref:Uncharacterized protein n=2 Tax=Staphylococcus pseudintermedius TaxID=283734 RepID=A0A0N9N9Z8_STAPS|nr:hypothetical protein [Staphylococcus pseudintermedius]ALG87932.1 hypothetical protein SP547_pKM00165 [Staphylococcus pseudintermedius]EGQ2703018.1 hypothetical protein [Staphylococcus pseudintermedius]EGQ3154356.1 hypothetical protein [Staphylococcus pseudintermedius]EGQ3173010.1 hypothetical protein [Staphylococcus pseudintermedius]EGQ3229906.1 hypothetical protein [Staphylococcus pseudintermedius]
MLGPLLILGEVQVNRGDSPPFMQTVKEIIEQVAGWAFIIAPSLALLLLILAGILYMNASSQMKREDVKTRFKNIFIGLLVVFFAVQIINFLISKFG